MSRLRAAAMRVGIAGAGILLFLGAAPPPERGEGIVSADHVAASRAGATLLQRGGNAVDAAVAAALAAGVVQPAGSGLGGGGFAVYHLPGAANSGALDFRETAPAQSTRDMYLDPSLKVIEGLSTVGGLAVGVPGESRGLAQLVREHGRRSPAQVAAPAIWLASKGYEVGPHLGGALSRTSFQSIRELLGVAGVAALPGARLRNPALARTLKAWARTAGEDLYVGSGARAVLASTSAAGGGLVSADLAGYTPRSREPIVVRWGAYSLVTMPPPSSGGVVLAQVLQVLEGYPLAELGHNSSDYLHVLAEAMKHAYADRAKHLGDPDFVAVPVDALVGAERVLEVQRAIWPGRTFEPTYYGELLAPPRDAGTQHISVIDGHGGAVALTTTINTSFGSGLVAGGLVLNNQMDDFSAKPGTANAYGLVGGEANAIQAGKRPLSSMTPTLVLDEQGGVVMSLGASGGSTIISATIQVFLNIVVFDMDPQEAVAAPRMHHQWLPDVLWLEPDIPLDVQRALATRGHSIEVRTSYSAAQAALVTNGAVEGGADPRKGGWPARSRP